MGCCCGQVDRGRPEVPVDKIKKAWKDYKLGKTIALTISGCLGPCDIPNVTLFMLPDQNIWLGSIEGHHIYDEIISWAIDSHQKKRIVPLSKNLESFKFDRFKIASGVA